MEVKTRKKKVHLDIIAIGDRMVTPCEKSTRPPIININKKLAKMTIFNFYIFDRNGTCLYYADWNRKKQSGMPKDEEFKLMYGMIFSIKSFVSRITPVDLKDGFSNFKTSKYKLHFYETPSGLKFIMNTDLGVGNTQTILHDIYKSIYVEYVVKNPICELGESVSSDLFKSKLDEYIKALPFFSAKVS